MRTNISVYITRLAKCPAATESAIAEFCELTELILPEDYLDFLKITNGAEGFLNNGTYVILWPISELVNINKAYRVNEYAPGLFLFGSDGGGDAFAFNSLENMRVVRVPFVGMDLSLTEHNGVTFTAFLTNAIAKRYTTAIMDPNTAMKEVFEIHPIILGGNPTDPSNKILLTREEHIKAVNYWNEIIRDIRRKS